MMDFGQIRLARVVRALRDLPRDGRPQVCFAGRSNVGKSSLINALTGRKGLARTSKTPGRTREIHFFLADDRAYLVDLPGYGYAKVSQEERRRWGRLIEGYLEHADMLRLVVVILDIRRDPNEDDWDLIGWLRMRAIPFVVVLAKSDKVSGNVRAVQQRRIMEALARQTGANRAAGAPTNTRASSIGPIRFSARTGEGKNELLRIVLDALAG